MVRSWSYACLDVGLLVAAVTLGFTALAAWTLRGDLLRPAWWVTATAVGLAWLLRTWWRARRQHGDPLRAAATIAAAAGPLSHRPDPRSATRERLLRHEILGALELCQPDPSTGGSPELAQAYVRDVARRLSMPRIDPAMAIPRPWGRPRWVGALVVGLAIGVTGVWAPALGGLTVLVGGVDARPPEPPEPVWSSLTLQLDYPAHTGRARRVVPNPSGALRVVAGTQVHVDLLARRPAQAGRIVVHYDPTELGEPHPPQIVDLSPAEPATSEGASPRPEDMRWTGSFVAKGSGSWTIVLLDEEDDDLDEAARRSAALPLQLEPDRPPEVDLLPLPRARREVSETDEVDLRFSARDDFGVVSAELVYQLPDGTAHRLDAGHPPAASRTWRNRYSWDISQIPISERSEVLYWIEVRDNDPGLGLVALPDPPGKVTRSATMRLLVKDDEAEHAANIAKLVQIRDAAVDLLAERMTTTAFSSQRAVASDPDPEPPDPPDPAEQWTRADPGAAEVPARPPLLVRVMQARDLMHRSSSLLTMLATAIDALSMDTLTHERDVATLTGIHDRLTAQHRTEMKRHEAMPPGIERTDPDAAERALGGLRRDNAEAVVQLEDEVIRLDDLVDGQIVERLEALVARLEATQRKLVELLEQLQAGDESVRSQIEQLEQRRREDLRRIAEARAMLRREVDDEFMNLDAFKILEEMAQHERLEAMLQRGEIDEALEQARGQLGEVQQLRDQVQQRVGEGGAAAPALSEEERKRMKLLRELSRLQDEQGTLRSETSRLHEQWRQEVGDEAASEEDRKRAARQAAQLQDSLKDINDARLGREGRRGLEDARSALQELQALSEKKDARQLELAEAAERAVRGLQKAQTGSEEREQEGRELRRASRRASGLERSMRGALPPPSQALPQAQREHLEQLQRRQEGLRKRASEMLGSEVAEPLPPPGRQAMRRADRAMDGSAEQLEKVAPRDALRDQSSAWDRIQEAIDSLRQGSPPPPSSSSSGDASTEAERDRSLRDQLMDAMKEGAPKGFDEPVKRYYEELLR